MAALSRCVSTSAARCSSVPLPLCHSPSSSDGYDRHHFLIALITFGFNSAMLPVTSAQSGWPFPKISRRALGTLTATGSGCFCMLAFQHLERLVCSCTLMISTGEMHLLHIMIRRSRLLCRRFFAKIHLPARYELCHLFFSKASAFLSYMCPLLYFECRLAFTHECLLFPEDNLRLGHLPES